MRVPVLQAILFCLGLVGLVVALALGFVWCGAVVGL